MARFIWQPPSIDKRKGNPVKFLYPAIDQIRSNKTGFFSSEYHWIRRILTIIPSLIAMNSGLLSTCHKPSAIVCEFTDFIPEIAKSIVKILNLTPKWLFINRIFSINHFKWNHLVPAVSFNQGFLSFPMNKTTIRGETLMHQN